MKISILVIPVIWISSSITGCATVPTQLKDAMVVQKTEIDNVRSLYDININALLDAVEKYQLEIINLHEKRFVAKESFARDEVDGKEQEVAPTGDNDIDYVYLSTLKKITEFFDAKRDVVRSDIAHRRLEYGKIGANFDNIEAVNSAVLEYINSLARLKNARDKVTQALGKKLTGLNSLSVDIESFPDPSSIEDVLDSLKVRG